jgi:hypothetical protein
VSVENGEFLDKRTSEALGEYKLSLDAVEYVQCVQDGERRVWQAQDPYPRVCEVDFSVTEPYVLQKTPSGTISLTEADLKDYKMYAN